LCEPEQVELDLPGWATPSDAGQCWVKPDRSGCVGCAGHTKLSHQAGSWVMLSWTFLILVSRSPIDLCMQMDVPFIASY